MDLKQEQILILKELLHKGGTGNVNEILSLSSGQFEEGFTIANDMQNKDLLKLLYSNFNKNLVVAELTLLGESEYNKLQ